MNYNEAWMQPRFEAPEMPYHCYGHFYQMEGRNCRSTLEIVQNVPEDPSILLGPDHQPDVVCVMMNPGGSEPCDPAQNPGACIHDPSHILENGNANLVCAVPDDTQNSIKRMMCCKNLSHVRVLNLFDIRNSSSDDFLNNIADLPPVYSIFSTERENERQARINPMTNIVVAAWGVDTKLRFNAKLCVDFVQSLGLCIHGHHNGLYYHPRRNSTGWLQYIQDNWPT